MTVETETVDNMLTVDVITAIHFAGANNARSRVVLDCPLRPPFIYDEITNDVC